MAKKPSKATGYNPLTRLTQGSFDPSEYIRARPFVQLLMFIAFITGVVAVMTAGFQLRDIALTNALVGTRAPRDIRVTRDFEYAEVNEARTRAMRESAANAVAAVYDWEESQGKVVGESIRKSFSKTRAAIAQELRANLPHPTSLDATPPTDTELLTQADEPRIIKLAIKVRPTAFDPDFQIKLSDEDFETFARARFSARVENSLTTIIDEVSRNLIVANIRALDAQRERGIYLRRLRNAQVLIEYHLRDISAQLLAMSAVPALLRNMLRQEYGDRVDPELMRVMLMTAKALVQPNTAPNVSLTQQKRATARAGILEQIDATKFSLGDVLVRNNELITERHVRIQQAMNKEDASWGEAQIIVGLALFSLLLFMILYLFGRHNIETFQPLPKDLTFLSVTMLLFLLITRLGKSLAFILAEAVPQLSMEAWYVLVPVGAAGMMVRLVLKSEHAIVFSILFGLLAGVIMDQSLFYAALTTSGCLVGAHYVRQIKHRIALIWSGLVIGVVNALFVCGHLLMMGEFFELTTIPHVVFLAMGGGLLSGFLVSAIMPVFESGFGYTTDIKLLELANMNNPLLRDLAVKAPGSYHHSMMVGSLCEAAAKAVGGNPLLARVGAYYHDIGKGKKPGYFAENQKRGENPHDNIKPVMSARIIKSHVREGADLAREANLPQEIIDFIEQHHGKSLIKYFYYQAKQEDENIDESQFRYDGPKPQTRETAICLLADGIEAASRAMDEPTPAKLRSLVQAIINSAFTDGQLDECDLTLRDLNMIEAAFLRTLNGIYHYRPKYPSDKKQKPNDKADRDTHRAARSTPVEKTRKITPQEEDTQDHDGGDDKPGSSDPSPGKSTSGD